MTRDWTPSDQADEAEDKAAREWWRKPNPFDPNNAPDPLSGCEGHGTEQSQTVEAVPGMNSTNKADL